MNHPYYDNWEFTSDGGVEIFDGDKDAGEIFRASNIETIRYYYERKARKNPKKHDFDKKGKYIFIEFRLKSGHIKGFCMKKNVGRNLIGALKESWYLKTKNKREG